MLGVSVPIYFELYDTSYVYSPPKRPPPDSGLCDRFFSAQGDSIKQFKRACRNAAKDVCESSIHDELKICGADDSLRTARPLKRKCRGEIRDLTGGRMLR